MAANAAVLSEMIKTNVHNNMKPLRDTRGYAGPLSQKNPSYFIEFCTAIGTGIANGSQIIQLKSADKGKGGSPAVPGVGLGTGIFVDRDWFNRTLYMAIYDLIKSTFGRTLHDPWFPSKGNSGEFLHAITKGISDAVADHYPTVYTLNGTHPLVYKGVGLVNKGMYSGLVPSNIEGLIIAAGPRMKGKFWPIMVKAISQVYVEAIHKNSTGTLIISGSCSPGPSQTCGINKTGFGIGTAI